MILNQLKTIEEIENEAHDPASVTWINEQPELFYTIWIGIKFLLKFIERAVGLSGYPEGCITEYSRYDLGSGEDFHNALRKDFEIAKNTLIRPSSYPIGHDYDALDSL